MISPARAWLLCFLLFLAAALCFLDRQVLSVLAPTITKEFGMSNTAYSRVVFAFVLSYTLMLALGGRVMDALGTRRGLTLAVGFWSLASAAHAFVTGPLTLGAARFFLGVGEGPAIPGAIKGAVEWMDAKRRGLAIGLASSGAAVGSVLAPPLTAWAAEHLGWRGAFAATAALGAAWLLAWILAFRGLPRATLSPTAESPRSSSWRSLLGRVEVRRLLAARFCFDPVFYFYMFWIPQYLSKERGMSLAAIGALTWIPFVFLEVANIGAGHVSDRIIARGVPRRKARMNLMLFAALLTPASFLAALAGTPAVAIGLMAVLMFAHGIWITNFMALIGDTVESRDVATTVGLTGTCGGIAGMLSNLIIGPVVDHYSFTPIFLASAVVYPLAWLILSGRVVFRGGGGNNHE
ncbi:MAG: MFS transporter [Verrucomicrobia bacterium]|nr:MFS transporter [Verrucomicrobiota bacterium]